jgi:hypothetical protein
LKEKGAMAVGNLRVRRPKLPNTKRESPKEGCGGEYRAFVYSLNKLLQGITNKGRMKSKQGYI